MEGGGREVIEALKGYSPAALTVFMKTLERNARGTILTLYIRNSTANNMYMHV